jgi:hypothetical protein
MSSRPVVSKFAKLPVANRPPIDARNGGDHAVWRGHGSAMSEPYAHDAAAGECRGFCEREDPVGETVAPAGQALLLECGPLVGAYFADTEGDLGSYHRRQCPAPHRCVRATRSQRGLGSYAASRRRRWCRGGSKLRLGIDPPVFANEGLQIEIAAKLVRQASIESRPRLAPRLANFISFERAFHDIGDGSMFTTRQAARQIASLGTTYRELGSATRVFSASAAT